jgi:5-methylcytosine-specific restriction endonuclease McrA
VLNFPDAVDRIKTGNLAAFWNCEERRQIGSEFKRNKKEIAVPAITLVARARECLTLGDSYTCSYCLKLIKWDHHRTRPTKDHFIPKSKKNLLMGAKPTFVICCQPCNSRKSDKVFPSIEKVREFLTSRKKAIRAKSDRN